MITYIAICLTQTATTWEVCHRGANINYINLWVISHAIYLKQLMTMTMRKHVLHRLEFKMGQRYVKKKLDVLQD